MRQFARFLVVAGLAVLLLTGLPASVAAASSGPADPGVNALLPVQSDPSHWVGVCVIGVPSTCNVVAWWPWWASWWWPWWAFRPIWEISALTGFTWPWWTGWWWPFPYVSLVLW